MQIIQYHLLMSKRFLTLAAVFMLAASAFAVPAKRVKRQVQQPYSEAIGVEGSRNPNRWKIAMNKLWETTKIVYYKVKGWNFNAFKDADLKEIYRLSALVVADIEIPEEAEEVVEEQVKFNPMDNCTGPNGEFIF